jgi:Holliday junction resolvasome RuvABC endonuclease subunit
MKPARLVLCLDVGFANTGVAIWNCSLRRFIFLDCISNPPKAKKQRTYVAHDNMLRCQVLIEGLVTIIGRFRPAFIIAEFPFGGSRNSKAAAAMSMSSAVVTTVANIKGLDLYPTKPSDTKFLVTGTNKAEKEEVIRWVLKKFGDQETADKRLLSERGDREHIADAMATLVVARTQYEHLEL